MSAYRGRRARLAFSAVLAVALFTGCGDSGPVDPLAPFQPQLSNVADNFAFQATGVTRISHTVVYDWANSGTRATINHATTTDAGSTQLIVKDGAGTTVYSRALAASLNEPTITGVAGRWTVQLTLTNYSGTINYRVQKL